YDFIAKTATAKAAIVNQPLPGLDIASSHGWAKVLKQATVITTNGSEATIEKIAFGTNVSVLPRYDPGTRNIEVNVKADVSDLTPPANSPLPGRQTSKLSTIVFLKL